MNFTYLYNGESVTVHLERSADGSYTATIGERTFPVVARALPDGGWLLDMGGRLTAVYAASSGSSRFVHVDGRDYTLAVPEARSQRRRAGSSGGDLTAQMPGQVMDVLVQEGETVQAGQTLLLLEAMKMEIRAAAPSAGVVKRLLVGKGDVVERGQLLAEIEVSE